MTTISEAFAQLRETGRGALIAYLPIGYPHPKHSVRLITALINGGADIIELGIPFSDPIADGPTIQNAVTRSLASGAKPHDTFEIARTIREEYDTPLVVMSYFNPAYRAGLPKFVQTAKKSGISGMIVPDLPVEESKDYKKECEAAGLDTIFLASPSTSQVRRKEIIAQTSGYLYLISLYGVTGVRSSVADSALHLIKEYRALTNDFIPLAVGFGISKPTHVRQVMGAGADGVIVGSAFVETIEENHANMRRASAKLEALAKNLKKAASTAK